MLFRGVAVRSMNLFGKLFNFLCKVFAALHLFVFLFRYLWASSITATGEFQISDRMIFVLRRFPLLLEK